MMNWTGCLELVITGFVCGSVPWGYLVGRAHGIDIRQHGSGNIGATNVFRVLGKKWGILVFFLDALKGVAAVVGGWFLARAVGTDEQLAGIVTGIACILGHNYTPWLGFKGGKGIATSAGVLATILWLPMLIGLGIWALVVWLTRMVSAGSIAAAASLPLSTWFLTLGTPNHVIMTGFAILIATLAIWRHRTNIQRILAGTENRFGKTKARERVGDNGDNGDRVEDKKESKL